MKIDGKPAHLAFFPFLSAALGALMALSTVPDFFKTLRGDFNTPAFIFDKDGLFIGSEKKKFLWNDIKYASAATSQNGFTVLELSPNNFSVTPNTTIEFTVVLRKGTQLSINLDGLSLGSYELQQLIDGYSKKYQR